MSRRLAELSDSGPVARRVKRRLLAAPLVGRTISLLDRRRLRRLEREGGARERSKLRWRDAPPGRGLTWGDELSGDRAAEAAQAQGAFGEGRTVLEVGPGYGRVLESCLRRGLEFERYIGLDLSAQNVEHLRREVDDPRVEILHGDAEAVSLDHEVDTVLSFLTFKHLYPSFEPALANLTRHLRPGGRVIFDLIEGRRSYFHRDQVTFIRQYSRSEITEILGRVSLELVAFDRVEHAPGRERLLVSAMKT